MMDSATASTTTTASLRVFRAPGSVAVVGASADRSKWGHWVAAGALRGRDLRTVRLVNHSAASILGERTFPSVRDLPEAPDLVALCVPPRAVSSVVDEALERGARGFLAITAGVPDERDLVARIRGAGARLIGPNSLGLYDAASRLQLAWGDFEAGSLAIVSQSGQIGSEIARLAARARLGVSRVVSIGNQADVRAAELLADLVDHEPTRTVALYLESFADGPALMAALRELAAVGKRTILLTAGSSDASRRLALSHTGSLTSSTDAVDAAARAVGAIRVATPNEVVDLARYLTETPVPRGRRVAILSDSGGQGAIAADVAAAVGLSVPALSEEMSGQLGRLLPAGAAVSNPVDLAGAGEADLNVYASAAEVLAASGEVDAVVVSGYLGCYGEDTPELDAAELAVVDRLGTAGRTAPAPVVLHSMSDSSRAVTAAAEQGMPVFQAIEAAMRTLASAAELGAQPGREVAGPGADTAAPEAGYSAARRFLSGCGVTLPPARPVSHRDELAVAVAELGVPVVLKAGWLAHKSEHGGVVLGLSSLDEVTTAYDAMRERLGAGEYVIEAQDVRAHSVEVIVGARRDPDIGPLITVGAGGVEAELHRDVRTELAPVDRDVALRMLRSLRTFPRLAGWRGRPPVDLNALADVVVRVSEAIAAHPAITELELNPVLAGPDGARAVDALVATSAVKEQP
jgi:acyl-CoA synthetase (NDP forming)